MKLFGRVWIRARCQQQFCSRYLPVSGRQMQRCNASTCPRVYISAAAEQKLGDLDMTMLACNVE